jgi:hypothetical protein
MASRLFAPKSYPIREPLMTGRRNGKVINPPRLAEMGGLKTTNADQLEAELTLKKPGGTT